MEIKLDEIIQNKLEEKFTNGEIEKRVSEALDKCLSDIIGDMFSSYSSPLKKELEEKLQPVISNAIANSTIEGLVDKLTILINKSIENKEISEISKSFDRYGSFEQITGNDITIKYKQKIKLSEIFEMYKNFVEKEIEKFDYNDEDWEYDEGRETVYWKTSLEKIEEDSENKWWHTDSGDTYKLSARPDNEDDIDEGNYNLDIGFKIYKNYDNKYRLRLLGDLTVNDLINAPKFILDLYAISRNYCDIEIDKNWFESTVDATIEKEY